METPQQVTEDLQVVKQDFESVKKKVANLEIRNEADKGIVAESIGLLKRMMQKAELARKVEVTPHNNTVDAINAKYNAFKIPANELLESLNKKYTAFTQKQREEADRLKAEQDRLLEEARKKQEAAEKKAEKKGLPPPPPPPMKFVEVPEVQKAQATSFGTVGIQEHWVAEGEDIRALCQAIVNHKAPTNCVDFNMVFLNKEAKRLRGESPYDGVKFIDRGKISLR